MIDLGLFRIRSYADGWTLALIYFGCLTAVPLVLTLYLQEGLGYSAIKAAGTGAAVALGVAVSSFISGRLLPRYGAKLLVVALIVLTIGLTFMIVLTGLVADSVPAAAVGALLLAPLAVIGLGMGGVTSPNQVLTYTHVDAAHGSTAAGMLQTAQRIGLAVGSAVGSAVFYAIALRGAPVSGHARAVRYQHAYLAGIGYVLVLALLSLVIAVRSLVHFREESLSLAPVRRV